MCLHNVSARGGIGGPRGPAIAAEGGRPTNASSVGCADMAAAALYEMAELPANTAPTLRGVTNAYHLLARELHPDRNDADDATERFQAADRLYRQAIAQLSAPPPVIVRRVVVPAETVLMGGAVEATYTRASTTESGDVVYGWHTETVPVAANAAMPATVTVTTAGDEMPGYAARGATTFELIDDDTTPVAADVVAHRVANTHDLVGWVTIETEEKLINGNTVAVASPFWAAAAAIATGEWPTMRPQPLVFPGCGLPTPTGTVGALLLYATTGPAAKLRPAVATKLAKHYRAACKSPTPVL